MKLSKDTPSSFGECPRRIEFGSETQKGYFEKPHDDLFRGSGKDNCAEAALAEELRAMQEALAIKALADKSEAVRKALSRFADCAVFSFDEFHLIEAHLSQLKNYQQILVNFNACMRALELQDENFHNEFFISHDSVPVMQQDLYELKPEKKTQAQVWARDWRKKRK